MQCPRCLNTDRAYFYKGSRGWYCRRCISFGRIMLEEENDPVSLSSVNEGSGEYTLQYPLTKAQAEIAVKCASLIGSGDVLLHCACGAGKTELVVLSISKMLEKGKKVCFAIPRRQVVLELRERLAQYFPHAVVTAVCGGHTSVTDGDLIICTTHQLYRYYQAFDLLILDEPDAFPFRGDPVLHGIARTSCKGHTVYLTATPDDQLMNRVRKGTLARLVLNERPHGHPLPVPVVKRGGVLTLWIRMIMWLRRNSEHPRIIFVPTILQAEWFGRLLKPVTGCFVCTSKTENRDEVIEAYRKEPAGIIIATTVLERGVTIKGADVCIYQADHPVFDEAGLVQMAGRAGRSFERPYGEVLFLLKEKSRTVDNCVRQIREANRR